LFLEQKVQAPFLSPKLGIFTPVITNQETTEDIQDFFFKTQNFNFVQISTHAAPTAKSTQRLSYMLNGLWFEYQQGLESFLLPTEPRPLLKSKHTPIQ
jgi:hypothetical protein